MGNFQTPIPEPRTPSPELTQRFSTNTGAFELWLAIVLPPIVWWLDQQAIDSMVPYACAGHWRLPFHLVSLVGFLISAGLALFGWRNWKALGEEWPGEGAGVLHRSRFMAVVGVLSGSIFFLVMLGQFIAGFFLGPCLV